MSNHTELYKVGNKYRFIVDLGDGHSRAIMAYYLGFQVEGGITHYGIKYQGKDGTFGNVYHVQGQYLKGGEPVEEVVTTAPGSDTPAETTTEKPSVLQASAELPVAVKRGRGRPRKDATAPISVVSAESGGTAIPKKRGRPRKEVTAPTGMAAAPVPVDANGVPLPRKRGRPRKDASITPPHVAAPHVTVPPHIPTPSVVEEVEEIEDKDTVVAPAAREKEVIRAVAPATEDRDEDSPKIHALPLSDDDVVPARQRLAVTGSSPVPTRPASSLARANRVPDEVEGDL